MRVLVVEDDAMLADVVVRGLRQAGMAVDVALAGADGGLDVVVRLPNDVSPQ